MHMIVVEVVIGNEADVQRVVDRLGMDSHVYTVKVLAS